MPTLPAEVILILSVKAPPVACVPNVIAAASLAPSLTTVRLATLSVSLNATNGCAILLALSVEYPFRIIVASFSEPEAPTSIANSPAPS